MLEQTLECFVANDHDTRPVWPVRPDGLDALLDSLPPSQAGYLRDAGFKAKAGDLRLLPGESGVAGAVFGLGTESAPFVFGGLPVLLPAGTTWRLEAGDYDPDAAILG